MKIARTRKRLPESVRRAEILAAAIRLARSDRYDLIVRDHVAAVAGVSTGLVTFHFRNMVNLRRAVMKHAIDCGLYDIVAQGLSNKDDLALNAPDSVRKEAIKYLTSQ